MFRFFARHPSYLYLTLSQTLSLVGSAFTALIVYKVIESTDSSPFIFTLVFLLSVAPGVFIAHFSSHYRHRFSIGGAMVLINVISVVALLVTWVGYKDGNIVLLLASEFVLSLGSGFLVPYNALYDKKNFLDDELEDLTMVDTITFGIQTILGVFTGTVLLSLISVPSLLLFDAFTFFIAFTVLSVLIKRYPRKYEHRPVGGLEVKIKLRNLTPLQARLFWIGPILASFGGPFMSLGPALVDRNGFESVDFGLALSPVLVFLFFRAMGQFVGPIVANLLSLDKMANMPKLLPICLFVYCFLYYMIWLSDTPLAIYSLVFVAHIFSNILFMVAYYSNLKYFSDAEISELSSKSYVYGTALLVVTSMISALVVSQFGYAVFFNSIMGIVVVFGVGVLYTYRNSPDANSDKS